MIISKLQYKNMPVIQKMPFSAKLFYKQKEYTLFLLLKDTISSGETLNSSYSTINNKKVSNKIKD